MAIKHNNINKDNDFHINWKFIIILTMVLAIVIFLAITLRNDLKEYNNIPLSNEFNVEDTNGKIGAINSYTFLESNETGFIAEVPFKDGKQYVYIATVDEPKENELDERFVGEFEITEDGYLVFYQTNAKQLAGFYYNSDHIIIVLGILFFSALFIYTLKKDFKYLKLHNTPIFDKGTPIDESKMNEILGKEPLSDNIWIDDGLILINDNNYITVKNLSDIIWVYPGSYTHKYNTTYLVTIFDKDGEKESFPFNEYHASMTFYDILRKKLPNAVHGYSGEKKRDFKDNKERFVSNFVKENETIDLENNENSLSDIELLNEAKKVDKKNMVSSWVLFIKVIVVTLAFTFLTLVINKYLPNMVENHFYKSQINPALSMLKAGVYSRLIFAFVMIVLTIGFLFFMFREILSKWKIIKTSPQRRALILVMIVWTAVGVMFPLGMVKDELRFGHIKRLYEDMKQIEDNKLTEKDIYIEENFYQTRDNDYLMSTTENKSFEIGMIVGVDYPLNEKSIITGYIVPWKSECPIDITDTGFNSSERNNDNAKVYRIKYTKNNGFIVDLKEVNK